MDRQTLCRLRPHKTVRAGFASACLLAASVFSSAARADFVGDLAQCAGGPIEIAAAGLDPAQLEKAAIAAEFAIDHGQCIPRVVAVDPLLVGMTVAVAGMQSQKILPGDADGCIDASLGVASKSVAGALDIALANAPGGGAILSSDARELLREIAKGETNNTLYQVPGFALVAETVTCGCAVASTGLPVEELKSQAKTVLQSVDGCEKVVGALLGGAYEAGAAAIASVNDAAAKIYGSAVDTVNAIGCELGFGGCDDEPEGPPFFCVGYESIRAQGQSAQSIVDNYSWMWKDSATPFANSAFTPMTTGPGGFGTMPSEAASKAIDAQNKEVDTWFAACDVSYQAKIDAAKKRKAEEQEEQRILLEIEKAEKLGSSHALRFAFDWIPKCRKDVQCEKGVSTIADQFNADLKDSDTIKQYGSFGAAAKAVYKKYSSNAGVAVAFADERRKKAIKKDRKAAVPDRLWAYDCKSFLGRERHSLCRESSGFDVCKGYAKAGQWDFCALGGKAPAFYANGQMLDENLRQAGCIAESRSRTGGAWQCLSPAARERCSAYRRGGSSTSCAHENEAFKRTLRDVLKGLQPAPPPATRSPTTAPATTPERAPARTPDPAPADTTILPTIRRLPPVAPPAEDDEDEAPRG